MEKLLCTLSYYIAASYNMHAVFIINNLTTVTSKMAQYIYLLLKKFELSKVLLNVTLRVWFSS